MTTLWLNGNTTHRNFFIHICVEKATTMMKMPPSLKRGTSRRYFLLYFVSIGCYVCWQRVVFHPPQEQWMRLRASSYHGPQMEVVNIDSNPTKRQPNSTQQQKTTAKHLPNFFTEKVALKSLLARNNILSVYTGCSIAAWTYYSRAMPSISLFDDCGFYNAEKGWKGRDITPETVSSIQPNDSIYVELMKLNQFAKHVLPHIKVDFVLISGQNHLAPMKPAPLRPPYRENTFFALKNSPHVTHWFMMNLDKHSYDPFHPKLHPFPYGLSYVAEGSTPPADFNPEAKDAYLAELQQNRTKDDLIFVGYVSEKSNPDRALVPQGEKLPPDEYYRMIQQSKYMIAPDGDRPETYRHYEAIGLGAMPITQLHPHLYRHLAGNVIFNETKWNMTELETTLTTYPKVNRRLLYEEYWMEYVERVVGRPMRWWDSSREARSSLSEITKIVASSMSQTSPVNSESQ